MSENKKKILVVEDDQPTRDALVSKLEQSGFDVISVNNGKECLDNLSGFMPDIVLMDVLMPVMGGIEALKEIRANKDTKDIPVVILTNVDSTEQVAEAMVNESLDYLVKSDTTLENIVEFINRKLEA